MEDKRCCCFPEAPGDRKDAAESGEPTPEEGPESDEDELAEGGAHVGEQAHEVTTTLEDQICGARQPVHCGYDQEHPDHPVKPPPGCHPSEETPSLLLGLGFLGGLVLLRSPRVFPEGQEGGALHGTLRESEGRILRSLPQVSEDQGHEWEEAQRPRPPRRDEGPRQLDK